MHHMEIPSLFVTRHDPIKSRMRQDCIIPVPSLPTKYWYQHELHQIIKIYTRNFIGDPLVPRAWNWSYITWLRCIDVDTVNGKFLHYVLENSQIEIVLPHHIFLLPLKTYSLMLNEVWIKQLWKFTDKHRIILKSEDTTRISLRRGGENFLMDLFRQGFEVAVFEARY